ncbi:hypothetical protein Tco_1446741 [Tanacetum coccineum]
MRGLGKKRFNVLVVETLLNSIIVLIIPLRINVIRNTNPRWADRFSTCGIRAVDFHSNALGYSTFRCNPDLRVLQIGIRAKVIENQGADEEISDRGISRVIVYGYDGLLMQPVAPPSPDYIPGPEEPQTPPVPQDEDEFIEDVITKMIDYHLLDIVVGFHSCYDPSCISTEDPYWMITKRGQEDKEEMITSQLQGKLWLYDEVVETFDEHVFSTEEKLLPPVDSPTTESLGYVAESDPEEDPEEYEDDETEDGLVDCPMDGGDDGDDDDGDSSGDDANDEDEDDEDEEEEEHLAPTDSAVVFLLFALLSPWGVTPHFDP